jgi:hypothetical protein
MATIKKAPKAQLGRFIKKGVEEVAEKVAPKLEKKIVIPPGLQKSIKKSQSGPTKITQYSSEAEKIAAGGPTKLQKSKTVNKFDPNYEKPYKPKKQPKVDKYGFDTRPDRNGGSVKKAKSGAKFDLNKDGKTTFKDVLIGRGVLPKTAKSGSKMAKQAATAIAMKKAGKAPKATMKSGGSMKKCKYGCK